MTLLSKIARLSSEDEAFVRFSSEDEAFVELEEYILDYLYNSSYMEH